MRSTFLVLAIALAQLALGSEVVLACVCQGCGCKGGPGWRDRANHCVSHKQLRKVCGDPPSTFCSYEGAVQVCPSEDAPRTEGKPPVS